MVTASMVPAVFEAADNAIALLLNWLATHTPGSPFEKRAPRELTFAHGWARVRESGRPCKKGATSAETPRSRLVGPGDRPWKGGDAVRGWRWQPTVSPHSFGCHFVEVTWQPEIARLRVSRVVTVIDAGRILNPIRWSHQFDGRCCDGGIGMARSKHTLYDRQNGGPTSIAISPTT